MKIGEFSILFILLQHMCLSQKLLFKQSPASFLELQKSNQKEGLLPLKPMHSQQNVIKTSKRSGMLCRSVCGKCEQILGQSWSLKCQHDCVHWGIPFRVCLTVTSYRDLRQNEAPTFIERKIPTNCTQNFVKKRRLFNKL